ncbi:MAG: D-alanyl-D-alanine carboxypeptidase, partial [Ottowia sp.]|nr:D-alanyl-D-alanine carboxypeptidase [Ottowia sp.]
LASLPVAGADGTLAGRFKGSPAQRNAFLKTGTLTGVRSLAGYVRGQSGQMIAVAIVVNSEQAGAAVPALDKFIEWVRQHG